MMTRRQSRIGYSGSGSDSDSSSASVPALLKRKDDSSTSCEENDGDNDQSSNESMPALAPRRGYQKPEKRGGLSSVKNMGDMSDSSSDEEEMPSLLPGSNTKIKTPKNDKKYDSDSSDDSMPALMERNHIDSSSSSDDDYSNDDDSSFCSSRSNTSSSISDNDGFTFTNNSRQKKKVLKHEVKVSKNTKPLKPVQSPVETSPLNTFAQPKPAPKKVVDPVQLKKEYATTVGRNLLSQLQPVTNIEALDNVANIDKLVNQLFFDDDAWTFMQLNMLSDIMTSFIEKQKQINELEYTHNRIRSIISDIIRALAQDEKYKVTIVSLLQLGDVTIKSDALINILQMLPKVRGDQFNNNLIKIIVSNCKVSLQSMADMKTIGIEASDRIGKKSRKDLTDLVKKSVITKKSKKQRIVHMPLENSVNDVVEKEESEPKRKDKMNKKKQKDNFKSQYEDQIVNAIGFYKDLLKECMNSKDAAMVEKNDVNGQIEELIESEQADIRVFPVRSKKMTSQEVVEELIKIEAIKGKNKEEEQKEKESKVHELENRLDLFEFNLTSECQIVITDTAKKWFLKHQKKQLHICERVIARLKMLSTGRFSYTLCKQLKTKSPNLNLYESKIDSGSRIIWEFANAYSERRSTEGKHFCEQKIQVWDIVDDHDKLSDRINLAIDRIERSRSRGEESNIYLELEECSNMPQENDGFVIPRVYEIKQVAKASGGKPKTALRYCPPANDDPQQYNLIKFHELNNDAVDLLLQTGKELDEVELPFIPGPKEHEIIHHKSSPQRSILLMGRSGTGKTTCLLFRMWSSYMANAGNKANEAHPKQLFITKNSILRDEVEKSFWNMGLAFKRRMNWKDKTNKIFKADHGEEQNVEKNPLFLTEHEWMNILDIELPGEHFFSQKELDLRSRMRNSIDDEIERGIQAILASKNNESSRGIIRNELTFKTFLQLWPKLNSRHKCDLDPAMVWREIFTFIKGSVMALKIDDPERDSPSNRFLDLQQYLTLPRKQSRLNQEQRKMVYAFYETYEKVKREGNYYDAMDIVYNLAGRVSKYLSMNVRTTTYNSQGFLPIDLLFVDEVQDFTMAELYLLTTLSRDPNNLMLAGDTAQSITEGVAFRFTDVRQIFYELFGGIEPDLLQLLHNYRSHSGILRLAASVVELLYFFFGDSLDRLPPDLGLLDGPIPIMMEVSSSEELGILLLGSKREVAKIEFGAQQSVIVRNDKVKKELARVFNIDEDWIMTVQESKGLEFDDVLLYNFFTESPAADMWRIVTNYRKEDAADYNSQTSGVQKFEWKDLMENIRELEFCHEKHKILETEMKILYTAITRAKGKIFIVETDKKLSSPMFSYFEKRYVAHKVLKGDSANIPEFGKMSSVADWRKAGESYLRAATGDNTTAYLRRAAKCFRKAGDIQRENNALAYLRFFENLENLAVKQDIRNNREAREKLYSIATQLLEAEDVDFLDKAGLCLLQSGEIEKGRSASIFELSARLSYAKRARNDHAMKPDSAEQRNFTYAAQIFEDLFEECDKSEIPTLYLIDAIRNYLCSGDYEGWKKAKELLDSNLSSLKAVSFKIHSLFDPSKNTRDPISYMYNQVLHTSKYQSLKDSIMKLM